jgi:phosphopantetheinyl transferase
VTTCVIIGRSELLSVLDKTIALFAISYPQAVDLDTAVLLAALAPEERERHAAMACARRRLEYLVGRALVRVVLSPLFGLPPRFIPLVIDSDGRPGVARHAPVACDFNLSHSHGHLVLGVTRFGRIGVDIEVAMMGQASLARRILGEEEFNMLIALPSEKRDAITTRIWTIKEAWSKALGQGLRVPFRRLNTHLRSIGGSGNVAWRAIDDLAAPAAVARASVSHPACRELVHQLFPVTLDQLKETLAS